MNSSSATGNVVTAESLNRGCGCRTLDAERLRRQLESDPTLAGLYDDMQRTHPYLFSATAVFVSAPHLARIEAIIRAVESVVAMPVYREQVLARAPAIARHAFGPHGAFMGYDFHLGADGPQLIEINTNAGGAALNAVLARAQEACCRELQMQLQAPTDLDHLEDAFFSMFLDEWRTQRGAAPLCRIAIVDEEPTEQFLYPEFRLFERLFRRRGVEAVIADARELRFEQGKVRHDGAVIDLVYNRLTDFYLEASTHAALRAAYEAGAVVLTPHSRAHALYSDKRNLIVLSDEERLTALGVPSATREVLCRGIPQTQAVSPDRADALWAARRTLFFKPALGYGSKATYRGDKLTHRVWGEILRGDYVAQAFSPPSERMIRIDEKDTDLKLDVRAYVYRGTIQLLAARLYSGQTTNFRTPGGGFAPVFVAA